MDIAILFILFVVGIAALVLGGEWLVKGASNLAGKLGISPLVIGLTVVAFGTSSPEFLVCLIAALQGSSDIVLGNIVGSNISNIALILGVASIVTPILVHAKLIRVEVPIMIVLSLALYAVSWTLKIGRIAGAVLFLALIAFTVYSYFAARRESKEVEKEFEDIVQEGSYLKQIIFLVLGFAGLIIGARLVVDSAISLAQMFGVSEFIIGITAIAIGTSLPELTTSIIAALRKEQDLIVGNIIGSNIFNIGILGLVSVIQPINVDPALLKYEFPVMLFFMILVLPLMKTGRGVSKVEGIVLLLLYGVFLFFLFNPIWI